MKKREFTEMDAMDWLRGCADCSCCKWENTITDRCRTCEERCNFEFKNPKRNK